MSLFQCEECGCVENTALCGYWYQMFKGDKRKLCSACVPATHSDGSQNSKGGKWHGQFKRLFLPKGMFKTNKVGNLEHIKTGSENYSQYEIEQSI